MELKLSISTKRKKSAHADIFSRMEFWTSKCTLSFDSLSCRDSRGKEHVQSHMAISRAVLLVNS